MLTLSIITIHLVYKYNESKTVHCMQVFNVQRSFSSTYQSDWNKNVQSCSIYRCLNVQRCSKYTEVFLKYRGMFNRQRCSIYKAVQCTEVFNIQMCLMYRGVQCTKENNVRKCSIYIGVQYTDVFNDHCSQ